MIPFRSVLLYCEDLSQGSTSQGLLHSTEAPPAGDKAFNILDLVGDVQGPDSSKSHTKIPLVGGSAAGICFRMALNVRFGLSCLLTQMRLILLVCGQDGYVDLLSSCVAIPAQWQLVRHWDTVGGGPGKACCVGGCRHPRPACPRK